MGTFTLAMLVLAAIVVVRKTVIVVPERHNVIKERLGKFTEILKPGWYIMIPFVDRAAYHQEVREEPIDVPSQSCITRDNIQVEVDGIVYLQVVQADKASYGIEDYRKAAINLAQTTMRSEIGKLKLDETFSERDEINDNIVREIDKASDPWGIKVHRYEIMNISPSLRVVDTMEKQMEAERQKRADITQSDGEKEAKINLSEGSRTSDINRSEGERQRRINAARGRAEAIRIVATASAQGIETIAKAIQKPGGRTAVKTQLVEQFVEQYGEILESADVSVVPEGLANMRGFFQGMADVGAAVGEE